MYVSVSDRLLPPHLVSSPLRHPPLLASGAIVDLMCHRREPLDHQHALPRRSWMTGSVMISSAFGEQPCLRSRMAVRCSPAPLSCLRYSAQPSSH
mmetsp:Transcript_28430/g.72844  ORF Transcript_28430/g.72844 Transcript_28430/m.72844 type:complete len:95 (+) Transcript_28430:387-671(+)